MRKHSIYSKLLSIFLLLITLNGFGAEVFFSQVYKGQGNTYVEESSSITILTSTLISSTNVSFVSYDPNATSFNGNNVVGYLKYTNSSGEVVRILVNATRPVKDGSTKQGLYLAVMRVNGSGQPINSSNVVIDPIASPNSISYSGDAYVFVISGQESYFSTNAAASPVNPIQTSSDQVDTFLNSILTSQPVITLSGSLTPFSTCSGTASGTQTLTVSGSNLSTNNITVTAPTGYEISKTSGGTYSSSLTYTPTSGSVSTSTFYIRLSTSATNGVSGNIEASSTGAATKSASTGTATVSSQPTTSAAGADQSNCGNATFTMAANTPTSGTGAWSVVSGTATITSTSSATTTITGITAGTGATLRWTISSSGCTPSTDDVVLTNNSVPTISGSTTGSRCGTGTVTLGATASAGTINWYAAATGGSSLGTGTSFTTPNISTTTTYYVDATSGSCTTA
ncbi:MAG: hypothetical protein RL131_1336, partial [Bacteroidota bacterium]